MAGDLIRYEKARHALAEARRVDEVMEVRSQAERLKLYARQAKDRELMADASEIQLRATRKLGEILVEAKKVGQLAEGRPKKRQETVVADDGLITRVTLEAAGISRDLSAKSQKTASISEQAFEAMVERGRERIMSGGAIVINPLKNARAVMASRQEADDSLDYFPTPPWATRALLEEVLPQLGIVPDAEGLGTVHEPACGEGHISGVLQEYGLQVVATDIYDYSANGRSAPAWAHVQDYLDDKIAPESVDWVITNPPFKDKAADFVEKALIEARRGVAMFLPLRWLETIDRYERIFSETPPTLIAFFVERVNVCKGRWDPEGGTATAYIWLVWQRGAFPRCPFWIPPGRREELERVGDRDRFTQQPVLEVMGSAMDQTADALARLRERLKPINYGTFHADPVTGEIVSESEVHEVEAQTPDQPEATPQKIALEIAPIAPVARQVKLPVDDFDIGDIPAFLDRRTKREPEKTEAA